MDERGESTAKPTVNRFAVPRPSGQVAHIHELVGVLSPGNLCTSLFGQYRSLRGRASCPPTRREARRREAERLQQFNDVGCFSHECVTDAARPCGRVGGQDALPPSQRARPLRRLVQGFHNGPRGMQIVRLANEPPMSEPVMFPQVRRWVLGLTPLFLQAGGGPGGMNGHGGPDSRFGAWLRGGQIPP